MEQTRMRAAILAATMLVAGSAFGPAVAQYYVPSYGPPAYGYREVPPRPYYRARASTVCVTSRGPCPVGGIIPAGAPCGCYVPGFGYKRGNAG
jgi:hypothetical protein